MSKKKSIIVLLALVLTFGMLSLPVFGAPQTMTNSWFVNNVNTNNTTDNNPYVYMGGTAGTYTALAHHTVFDGTNYAWQGANNGTPWIAPWFMSAGTDKDGVVSFVAAKDCTIEVKSTSKLKLENTDSDGLDFMVLQKSAAGFYPLYPSKGKWEWKSFTKDTAETTLDVKTYAKAGDEIMYIVKSTGTPDKDVLLIDPQVVYDEDAAAGGEYVRPTEFTLWNGAQPVVSEQHNNSWYINNQNTNSTSDNNPYAYYKGYNGVYTDLLTNHKSIAEGQYAWTDAGDKQPWIGPWFIGASTKIDGVVSFTAPENGTIEVKSTLPVKLETGGGKNSDGLRFIIVQKMADKYYPLYPSKGKWEYKTVSSYDTQLTLEGIKTYANKGDEIMVIVQSTGTPINDTLQIDPQIIFGKNAVAGGEYVRPDGTAWSADEPQVPSSNKPSSDNTSKSTDNSTKNSGTGDAGVLGGIIMLAAVSVAGIYAVNKRR